MLSPMEIAVGVGVVVLIFGAEKLPKLARSAGEMRREFERGQSESEKPAVTAETAAPPADEVAKPAGGVEPGR